MRLECGLPLLVLVTLLKAAAPYYAQLGVQRLQHPRAARVRCGSSPPPDLNAEPQPPPSKPMSPRVRPGVSLSVKKKKSKGGKPMNWHVVSLYRQAQTEIKKGEHGKARTLLLEAIDLDAQDAQRQTNAKGAGAMAVPYHHYEATTYDKNAKDPCRPWTYSFHNLGLEHDKYQQLQRSCWLEIVQ